MDEKKAFEIRRKVLESGVDFEEYISKQQAEIDALARAAIDFIDQMRVQGCEGYTLPAEYDTLVDVVDKHRGK